MMKKIIGAALLTTFMSGAFAQNCLEAYEMKSAKRDALKMGVVASIGVASFATGTVPLFLIGSTVGLGTSAIINKGELRNQFSDIEKALIAAHYGELENPFFIKLANKIQAEAQEELDMSLDHRTIAALIREADRSMNICPLVRTKRNGEEVRSVMNKKGLIEYILNIVSTGKTEVKILQVRND
jgi:hypothetical protein